METPRDQRPLHAEDGSGYLAKAFPLQKPMALALQGYSSPGLSHMAGAFFLVDYDGVTF
jgi:hypothetical protein